MKKAYTLKVGDHVFVFSSTKAVMAAYEILECADFHGKREWRGGGDKLVEVSEGLETKTVYREELALMTREDYEKLEAIDRYKSALTSDYHKDEASKQKAIDRAYKVLLDLGIDPETIDVSEEEED